MLIYIFNFLVTLKQYLHVRALEYTTVVVSWRVGIFPGFINKFQTYLMSRLIYFVYKNLVNLIYPCKGDFHAIVLFFSIIRIPDEELFPKRPSGSPLHTLSNLYDVPVGFAPTPLLMLRLALFAAAEGWLLLDIGWFVLVISICNIGYP